MRYPLDGGSHEKNGKILEHSVSGGLRALCCEVRHKEQVRTGTSAKEYILYLNTTQFL